MADAKEILIEYIKENQNKFYRVAYSYSKNEESALDIVQDSIIKGLQNIHKLREPEYVKTWFYRILINESLQYIKKNKRLEICQLEEIENKVDISKDIEIDDVDLYNNIQNLKPKIKTVITLRYFEDMKIDEIAKITKTNINTVKTRLYKGIQELKDNINKKEGL